ncbi:unnamed protein product [Cyprideis torosa]|uniref:Uncharacterized protein n=1 Tax=Cyprideis torosa TaxID=163714 RepID=A0A7R8W391_9CRUS|nr:unnamed protein product [Cyprideis torosa]CAG0882758.1 unnamed protein product [Cyprideis torosa]
MPLSTKDHLLSLVDDIELISKELISNAVSGKTPRNEEDELSELLVSKQQALVEALRAAKSQATLSEQEAELQAEVDRQNAKIIRLQKLLKEAESLLATAIFEAKQKLASGDPRRPYPTDLEMRQGVMANPHLGERSSQVTIPPAPVPQTLMYFLVPTSEEDLPKTPRCVHGPMLVFRDSCSERVPRQTASSKRRKKMKFQKLSGPSIFFACSADRANSSCKSRSLKEVQQVLKQVGSSHSMFQSRETCEPRTSTSHFKEKSGKGQMLCRFCGQFVSAGRGCCDDQILIPVSAKVLKSFSANLVPRQKSSKQAQVLFSQQTLSFIRKSIQSFQAVLCIGCPTVFEFLLNQPSDCLLMDIDERFHYFGDKFVHYNMFNHHFFHARDQYRRFLERNQSSSIVVVVDPPFGGRLDVLAVTLSRIRQDLAEVKRSDDAEPSSKSLNLKSLDVLLVFPYFNEAAIRDSFPDLRMSDFVVSYRDLRKFRSTESSPVRVFSSFPLDLSELDSYWFCGPCDRWSAAWNRHCDDCGACTVKTSAHTYKHCDPCGRCVKEKWEHCAACDQCHLSVVHGGRHVDVNRGRCHGCAEAGHREVDCPVVNRAVEGVLRNWRGPPAPKRRRSE